MKARLKTSIARYLLLSAASFMMALNYRTFVEWGGLYPAGVTGLTMLIQRVAQDIVDALGFSATIPFSPINITLNAIPAWIGFKYIGKKFTARSIFVIMLTGFFTDIMPVDVINSFIPAHELSRLQTDPFVTSIFGGILFGFAMSLCLRWNATTGGTDFIAIFMSEKKGRETWNMIMALNAAILLCGGFKFGWSGALYSIVYQFMSLQVVHIMYRTYQYQTLHIITTEPDKISEAIYRISHHGATIIDAKGSFSKEERKVVMSVVAADDTSRIYSISKSIDPNAFITTTSTSRVIGRFYLRPRD